MIPGIAVVVAVFLGFLFFVLVLALAMAGLVFGILALVATTVGLRSGSDRPPALNDARETPPLEVPRASRPQVRRPSRKKPWLILGGLVAGCIAVALIAPLMLVGLWFGKSIQDDHRKDAAQEALARLAAAETAYSSNGGYYDTPSCLARPEACIPSYRGSPFIDLDSTVPATRDGYRFGFRPGDAVSPPAGHTGRISASSVSGYVFTATALDSPGVNYCIDARGMVCVPGTPVDRGVCPCDANSLIFPRALQFRHVVGQSPCPQKVGSLHVGNPLDTELTTDVRTAGKAPLSFGPSLTLAPHGEGSIDVFFTCETLTTFRTDVRVRGKGGVSASGPTFTSFDAKIAVYGAVDR